MSAASANLAIRPDLCDRCGKCVAACPRGELRVGGGYIYVDASACNGCLECAHVCRTGAISARTRGHASDLAVKPGEVAHVVVRSRAEAKALRKAAHAAAEGKPKARRPMSTPIAKARSATEPVAAMRSRSAVMASTSKATAERTPVSRLSAPAAALADGARWTPVDAAAVAGVLLVGLLAKEVVLGSAAVKVMPAEGRSLARAVVLAVFYATQIALLALLSHRRGMKLLDAFRLRLGAGDRAAALRSAGLVVALLLATRLLSTGWGALSQGLGWTPSATESLSGVFGGGSLGLVLTVALVVFVGPLVEELAFRGVIAGALDLRFGLRVAVLVSALAFAAYHLTPWVLVPTFVLGVALAWLALTRETLWPAYALHALYNGVVVAAIFLLPVR